MNALTGLRTSLRGAVTLSDAASAASALLPAATDLSDAVRLLDSAVSDNSGAPSSAPEKRAEWSGSACLSSAGDVTSRALYLESSVRQMCGVMSSGGGIRCLVHTQDGAVLTQTSPSVDGNGRRMILYCHTDSL